MRNARAIAPLAAALVAQFVVSFPARAGQCGPRVRMSGVVATVLPSGSDDTVALQCVFDAVSGQRDARVRLVAGTYRTSSLYINDFQGVFAGAGADATTITNGPIFASPNWFLKDPSRDNAWPTLLNVRGGHFQVRDLSISVRGQKPVADWLFPGLDVHLNALGVAINVFGKVDAQFQQIHISGESDPVDPLFGYNLYNGIYFQKPAVTPASGSFAVHDSRFASMGSWVPLFTTEDATVRVTGNDVEDVFAAFDIFSLQRTGALYAHNRVRDAMLTSIVGPLDASWLGLIGNNIESGAGIAIMMDFTNGASCSILGNRLSVPNPAILLGPGTSHCLVAGNHGASVVDQGTNNLVIRR